MITSDKMIFPTEAEETSDKTVKTASLYAKQETIVTGLLKGVR